MNILDTDLLTCRTSPKNVLFRKIKSDKLTIWKSIGHGEQVGAVTAADLEHPAVFGMFGVYSMQLTDGRETVGMSLRKCVTRIWKRIVSNGISLHAVELSKQ
jgi:hypothetical protein